MAVLLNRFGRRLAVLESLSIEYPVSRSGVRFEARLPTQRLEGLDLTMLRYFVVQDDGGQRYPAMIDDAAPSSLEPSESTLIRGVVVAHG